MCRGSTTTRPAFLCCRPRPASTSKGGVPPPCKVFGLLCDHRHPTHQGRLRQSARLSVSLLTGSPPWCLRGPWDDNAVFRRSSDRTAAASRMSRLRTVSDGSRVDACHACSVWALFDDFASHDHPLARLHHCSDVCF